MSNTRKSGEEKRPDGVPASVHTATEADLDPSAIAEHVRGGKIVGATKQAEERSK